MSMKLEDAQAFATAIDRLAKWLRRQVPSQLSMTSVSALDRLHHEGPLRVSDLAERESMTQPGVTLLVNRLSEAGHAVRVPDPTDRRAALVQITTSGSALLADRQSTRAQFLRERIAGLSDDEQRLLAAALPAIQKLVGVCPTATAPLTNPTTIPTTRTQEPR